MTTTDDLNQALLTLWQQQTYSTLVPMLYPELHKHSFLWVGINPSYSPQRIKPVLRQTDYESLAETETALEHFFTYTSSIDERAIQQHQHIQRLHHQKYAFFRSREKLYEEVKANLAVDLIDKMPPIEHVDLFHVRVTDSQAFYRDMRNPAYATFFHHQLGLFKQIVDYIDPSLIMIANAALSNYLLGADSPIKLVGQPLSCQLDPGYKAGIKTGTASINGRAVPVYFFKQLTGGGTKTSERQALVEQLAQTFANLCGETGGQR